MSNIFKSFVDSYRVQDSIGIEQGYREMAPAWKINGQNKYLQAWVEQLDTLNEKFVYSRTQEYRTNSTVRTYHASTGKNAIAHDEFVEIVNRDLSLLGPVHSVMGFVHQGDQVGPARRCKRFAEMCSGPGKFGEVEVYRSSSGSKGNHTPEKQMIYEVATLFLNVPKKRVLLKSSVRSLKCKVTMIKKLKRTKLQSEMNDVEDSELSRLHEGVRNAFASIRLSTVGGAACSNEVNDSIAGAGVNFEEDVDKALEAEMAAESSLTQGEQMAAMLEATESMQFCGNNDEDNEDDTLIGACVATAVLVTDNLL